MLQQRTRCATGRGVRIDWAPSRLQCAVAEALSIVGRFVYATVVHPSGATVGWRAYQWLLTRGARSR